MILARVMNCPLDSCLSDGVGFFPTDFSDAIGEMADLGDESWVGSSDCRNRDRVSKENEAP